MENKIQTTSITTTVAATKDSVEKVNDIKKRIELTAGTLIYSEDVLIQIFNYLDVKSLQACRRICHVWEEVATEILLHRRILRINFYWEAPYYMTCGLKDDIKLADVSNLMKNSRLFPCESFSFHEGNINEEGIQNFLTVNGSHVRELLLDLYWDCDEDTESQSKVKTRILKKLLGEQCTKLEAINFHFASETWDSDSDSEGEEEKSERNNDRSTTEKFIGLFSSPLQSLKFITIDRKIPTPIFEALLSAAVNLQEIYFDQQYPYGYLLDDYNLDSLIRTNKLSLLKNLSYLPYATDLQLYEVIVMHGLRLDTIKIYLCYVPEDEWEKAGSILSKAFLLSSSQLTKILHFPPLGFVPHFVIPTLPALTEVKIANYHSGDGCFEDENPSSDVRIFPSGFNPKYSFPNLERVELDFRQGENLTNLKWEDYFPDEICSIPSVKTLTCSKDSESFSSDWIRKLRLMFPNLVHADFPFICDFSSVSQEIWKFEYLETLKLNVAVTTQTTILDISFLAAFQALTGFGKDTCACIFRGGEPYCLMTAEMERVNPSILDLKRLKKISVCFSVCPYCDPTLDEFNNSGPPDKIEELRKKEQNIFSDVVSSYALLFCPHLTVSFKFEPEDR